MPCSKTGFTGFHSKRALFSMSVCILLTANYIQASYSNLLRTLLVTKYKSANILAPSAHL